MKKFASVLLAVLVAFSMFSFVVSAAGVTLTASADKTNVNVGDTVKLTVAITEKSNLASLTVDVKYDNAVFEVVSLKGAGLFTAETVQGMEMPNAKYAADKARFVAVATYALEEGGTAFTAEFKAVKAGACDFELVVSESLNADNAKIDVTVNSVKVTVAEEATEPSTDPTEPSTDPTEPSTDPTEPSEPSEDEDPCADGHTWSTWAVEKVAECKKDGLKARNCTVCGEKETEVIPATGKCAYKWVVTKEATATEYGEKQLKCTMCGHVKETQKLAVKNESADSLDKPAIPNTDAIA